MTYRQTHLQASYESAAILGPLPTDPPEGWCACGETRCTDCGGGCACQDHADSCSTRDDERPDENHGDYFRDQARDDRLTGHLS